MADVESTYEQHLQLIRDFHALRKAFSGRRTFKCLDSIHAVCRAVGAGSLLDYGCGKGEQWEGDVFATVVAGREGATLQEFLGLTSVLLYDPGVPEHEAKPPASTAVDVVTVVDVLEYVPLANLSRIVAEVFSYGQRCVYFNLTCNQPRKSCQLDKEWQRSAFFWLGQILQAAVCRPSVAWFARMETGELRSQRELVAGVGDTVAFTGTGQFSVDDVRRVLSRSQPA